MMRLESPEEANARLESETLTEVERARLWARIRARTAHRSTTPLKVVALAALALSAAAVAVLVWRRADVPRTTLPRSAAACMLDGSDDRFVLPLSCPPTAVRVGTDEWVIAGGAELTRFEGGARLLRGTTQFHVQHRPEVHFYVQVSHGEVHVVGTRFEVRQAADGGSVAVSEGTILFVWLDGSRERVSAGQTLHWPKRAGSIEPAPAAASSTALDHAVRRPAHDGGSRSHTETASNETDLERVTERLLQLKSQHRFSEVVTLLETTLASRALGKVQRERLSYELGLALEASGRSACSHWKRHVERFGPGAHGAALTERLKKCEEI